MSRDLAVTPLPWTVQLDHASATPVYVQVAQGLRLNIESRNLACGTALPAERDLAAQLGVSRVTVRQALGLLADQGVICRKHGSGTFVMPKNFLPARPLDLLTSFSEDIRARGKVPGAKILNFERTRPTPHEAMSLGLSPTEVVYRLRRLRTANEEALAIEESTLPAGMLGVLSEEDVTDASLYALLAARGLPPQRTIRHLRAMNADQETAKLLNIDQHAALLVTERVSWTLHGRPIEYAKAYYRGDKFDFFMELNAGEQQNCCPMPIDRTTDRTNSDHISGQPS